MSVLRSNAMSRDASLSIRTMQRNEKKEKLERFLTKWMERSEDAIFLPGKFDSGAGPLAEAMSHIGMISGPSEDLQQTLSKSLSNLTGALFGDMAGEVNYSELVPLTVKTLGFDVPDDLPDHLAMVSLLIDTASKNLGWKGEEIDHLKEGVMKAVSALGTPDPLFEHETFLWEQIEKCMNLGALTDDYLTEFEKIAAAPEMRGREGGLDQSLRIILILLVCIFMAQPAAGFIEHQIWRWLSDILGVTISDASQVFSRVTSRAGVIFSSSVVSNVPVFEFGNGTCKEVKTVDLDPTREFALFDPERRNGKTNLITFDRDGIREIFSTLERNDDERAYVYVLVEDTVMRYYPPISGTANIGFMEVALTDYAGRKFESLIEKGKSSLETSEITPDLLLGFIKVVPETVANPRLCIKHVGKNFSSFNTTSKSTLVSPYVIPQMSATDLDREIAAKITKYNDTFNLGNKDTLLPVRNEEYAIVSGLLNQVNVTLSNVQTSTLTKLPSKVVSETTASPDIVKELSVLEEVKRLARIAISAILARAADSIFRRLMQNHTNTRDMLVAGIGSASTQELSCVSEFREIVVNALSTPQEYSSGVASRIKSFEEVTTFMRPTQFQKDIGLDIPDISQLSKDLFKTKKFETFTDAMDQAIAKELLDQYGFSLISPENSAMAYYASLNPSGLAIYKDHLEYLRGHVSFNLIWSLVDKVLFVDLPDMIRRNMMTPQQVATLMVEKILPMIAAMEREIAPLVALDVSLGLSNVQPNSGSITSFVKDLMRKKLWPGITQAEEVKFENATMFIKDQLWNTAVMSSVLSNYELIHQNLLERCKIFLGSNSAETSLSKLAHSAILQEGKAKLISSVGVIFKAASVYMASNGMMDLMSYSVTSSLSANDAGVIIDVFRKQTVELVNIPLPFNGTSTSSLVKQTHLPDFGTLISKIANGTITEPSHVIKILKNAQKIGLYSHFVKGATEVPYLNSDPTNFLSHINKTEFSILIDNLVGESISTKMKISLARFSGRLIPSAASSNIHGTRRFLDFAIDFCSKNSYTLNLIPDLEIEYKRMAALHDLQGAPINTVSRFQNVFGAALILGSMFTLRPVTLAMRSLRNSGKRFVREGGDWIYLYGLSALCGQAVKAELFSGKSDALKWLSVLSAILWGQMDGLGILKPLAIAGPLMAKKLIENVKEELDSNFKGIELPSFTLGSDGEDLLFSKRSQKAIKALYYGIYDHALFWSKFGNMIGSGRNGRAELDRFLVSWIDGKEAQADSIGIIAMTAFLDVPFQKEGRPITVVAKEFLESTKKIFSGRPSIDDPLFWTLAGWKIEVVEGFVERLRNMIDLRDIIRKSLHRATESSVFIHTAGDLMQIKDPKTGGFIERGSSWDAAIERSRQRNMAISKDASRILILEKWFEYHWERVFTDESYTGVTLGEDALIRVASFAFLCAAGVSVKYKLDFPASLLQPDMETQQLFNNAITFLESSGAIEADDRVKALNLLIRVCHQLPLLASRISTRRVPVAPSTQVTFNNFDPSKGGVPEFLTTDAAMKLRRSGNKGSRATVMTYLGIMRDHLDAGSTMEHCCDLRLLYSCLAVLHLRGHETVSELIFKNFFQIPKPESVVIEQRNLCMSMFDMDWEFAIGELNH